MTAMAQVIRNTPMQGLRGYFEQREVDLGGIFNERGYVFSSSSALLKAIEELEGHAQAVLTYDFERIQEMTDESGQAAIQNILEQQGQNMPDDLLNAHHRALWLFLNDPDAFRRAEEVRYADNSRQGRMWSGFVGPRHLAPSRNPADHRRFEERVMAIFATRNAKLDLFERIQIGHMEERSQVVQAVIYREGLPSAKLEFGMDGELALHPFRPVFEVAITYQPDTGVIEVVAQGDESRSRLARLFAEVILQQGIMGLRVPLRQYDLSRLLQPCDFASDPEDGIDAIKVVWMKMQQKKSKHPGVALIAGWENPLTVYDHLHACVVDGDEAEENYDVNEATVSIRLRPIRGGSYRRKTINVTITLPNRCTLKSKTTKERLICDKYLPRWGLVKEV